MNFISDWIMIEDFSHLLHNDYNFETIHTFITSFGDGLINHTWKIVHEKEYIMQRINNNIFKQPQLIDQNIRLIGSYLEKVHPDYRFIRPVVSRSGLTMICNSNKEYYRIFPFVSNSISYNILTSPVQAYEASQQFGRFTSLLCDFPLMELQETLPDFHNLTLRHQQFLQALEEGNPERLQESRFMIEEIKSLSSIVDQYAEILRNEAVKKRVTHHDTKINNVLFDRKTGQGLCVIDLDTVMPGYFFSDVGDMIRTYVSPVSEEEGDFSLIEFREEYFQAIIEGYYREMKGNLTSYETTLFLFAGKMMIYMQTIRFLTDYLMNDIYYHKKYEKHNLHRAMNQLILLQRLIEKESKLNEIINKIILS